MLRKLTVFGTLLVAALFVSGCKDGGGKASTPKEALKNFVQAVDKGDKALFVTSVDMDKGVAEGMFAMTNAMMAFAKKFEDTYGESMPGSGPGAVPTPEDLDKAEITIEGDTASAKMENDTVQLVKKDGIWLISMGEQMNFPDDKKAEAATAFSNMATSIDGVTAQIGQEGMTKEQIGMQLMGAMMGAAAVLGGEGGSGGGDEGNSDDGEGDGE